MNLRKKLWLMLWIITVLKGRLECDGMWVGCSESKELVRNDTNISLNILWRPFPTYIQGQALPKYTAHKHVAHLALCACTKHGPSIDTETVTFTQSCNFFDFVKVFVSLSILGPGFVQAQSARCTTCCVLTCRILMNYWDWRLISEVYMLLCCLMSSSQRW